MAWLSAAALCFSIYAGYANLRWWLATGLGLLVGFVIAIWRMSNRTLHDPVDGGPVKSDTAAYRAFAVSGASVAAFQTLVYFISLSLLGQR